jgi:cation:H+ antiporter
MNILVILGVTGCLTAVAVAQSTIRYEIPFVFAITLVLFIMGMDGTIRFADGVILWILFIMYLLYLLRMAKKEKQEEPDAVKDSLIKQFLMLVIGAVLIVIGADVSVDAASELARMMGLSERLIGLTIVALGTSLPELCTSVVAAVRGKADLAIGNIVGSNIFNILFVVGTTALIVDVPFHAAFLTDTVVAMGAVILLWLCVLPKKKLTRTGGVLMLLSYAGYFVYLMQK